MFRLLALVEGVLSIGYCTGSQESYYSRLWLDSGNIQKPQHKSGAKSSEEFNERHDQCTTPKMTESSLDRRRRGIRATALGVRFMLELCILASLAELAAHLPVPILAQVLIGLLFCGTGAAVWGAFLSPKRKYQIGPVARLVLETGFFAGAALILNHVGRPALGVTLALAAVADRIVLALIR